MATGRSLELAEVKPPPAQMLCTCGVPWSTHLNRRGKVYSKIERSPSHEPTGQTNPALALLGKPAQPRRGGQASPIRWRKPSARANKRGLAQLRADYADLRRREAKQRDH